MAGPWEQYRAAPDGPWSQYEAKPAAKPKRDTNAARGVALGALKPLDNLARGISRIPVVGPALDAASEALGMPTAEEAYQANQQLRRENVSTGGQIAGNIAGTLPLARLPGGPIGQGLASGVLLSDAETPEGLAADAGMGVAGALVGQGVVNTVRGVVAPRVSDYVRRLGAAGVEMTPGQIMGGVARRLEDVATVIPGVGDAIKAAQGRSIETFNRAAVNRALAPIGQALPNTIAVGRDAVRFAGDVLSRSYDEVLSRIGGTADDTLTSRLNAIQQRADLPDAERGQLAEIVDREIVQRLGRGEFTGRQLNQVRDRLDKLAASYRQNTQSPYARMLGEAIGEAREQVLALARRQNPGMADALRRLDRGYAELVRVEKAATNATDGVFTPAQYDVAVRTADRSVRKRAVARGEAVAQELSDAARAVLPPKVPDSGTIGRALPFVMGGGAVAAPAAIPYAIAGGVAAAGAYSRPATRAVQGVMLRNVSPQAQYVGRLLERTPVSVVAPAATRRRDGE